MFTSSTAGSSSEFEVMVWLSSIGPKAVPIGGMQPPIAEVNLAGSNWKLYHGTNGNMNIYSFVASSQLTWFSADLMVFLNYMADHQGVPKSHILQSVHAGTEAFTGWDVVFTTSSYTLSQS
jgi:xyloglucan-specific endo-beta-1,4-glucanase